MSRFDKVKITFTDGSSEEIRGYSQVDGAVLHIKDHDGFDPPHSFPLHNIRKYEVVR